VNSHSDNRVRGSLKRISEVILALESHNSAYRVIESQSPEAEAIADWIESHFPIVGVQIDWDKVASSRCIKWSDTSDLVRSFATIVCDLSPEANVIVTWSDALYPSLEMKLSEVVQSSGAIFEACFDTYIVCQSENWCIEVHHEGTICFGYGRPSFVFLGVKERS
jgi:hypothetical protein